MTEADTTQTARGKLLAVVTAACLIAITWLVYSPGLRGPFVGDDVINILDNPAVAISDLSVDSLLTALGSNSSGPSGRPLPGLSFGLSYWFAGEAFVPVHFKKANLALHMLNGLLVYLVAFGCLRLAARSQELPSRACAVVVSAAWLLHPLQLTTVLYAVQRINGMAATGVLLGLVLLIHARLAMRAQPHAWGPRVRLLVALGAGGLLGLLSKENAIAILAFAAAIEMLIRSSTTPRRKLLHWSWLGDRNAPPDVRIARRFYTFAIVAAIVGFLVIAGLRYDFWAEVYSTREFTMNERVMTQLRALWWYLGQIGAPRVSSLGLYHDDWLTSTSWLNPWTTTLAAGAWLAALVAAATVSRLTVWFRFAVVWYLGGMALESTIVPLEMVFEHRTYLPSLGPILALCAVTAPLLRPALLRVSAVVMLATFAATTAVRAQTWGDALILFESNIRHHPRSAASQSTYAVLLRQSGAPLGQVYEHYTLASAANPNTMDSRMAQLLIVAALQLAQAKGQSVAPMTNAAGVTLLAVSAPALARQRDHLIGEVTTIVNQRALSKGSVATLANLANCTVAGDLACVSLVPKLEHWLWGVSRSQRMTTEDRQLVLWAGARALVAQGYFESAQQLMRENVARNPSDSLAAARLKSVEDAIRERATDKQGHSDEASVSFEESLSVEKAGSHKSTREHD